MFELINGKVTVSVRELVEFVYKSGDIESGKGVAGDYQSMQAGSKIHRKLQKMYGSGYKAEVPIRMEITRRRYSIVIEGRMDGLITKDDSVCIDEIKGTYADVNQMEEPVYVHLAQAMSYAYMHAALKDLETIGVRMTYVNMDSEAIRYFEEEYTIEQLSEWMEKTLEEIDRWIEYLIDHKEKRDRTVKPLEFPFEYREGQKNLCVGVYKTIARKKSLFIQASTGVGKTMSTVFPTVKAMGEGIVDKIFYLTAKTITRTVARESLEILENKGLYISSLVITAKEKICTQKKDEADKKMRCNPIDCSRAKGHYDRVNEAVYDLITHENQISRELIEEYACKHQVCPFEMSLDVSYWCDVIICDYNYVFDPNVYLRRFFAEGNESNYVFLIDEAHNLVDRGREMYSATLVKEDILDFKKVIAPYDKRLSGALERCNKAMLTLKRECEGNYKKYEDFGFLYVLVEQIYENMLRFSENNRTFPDRELFNEFFFKIRDFVNVSSLVDDKYILYSKIDSEGKFLVRQYCVDPSANLCLCMEKGRANVLFSATLLPVNYYKKLLRGEAKEDYAVYAKSSFDSKNRLVLMAKDVTTKYSDRGERQYRRVVEYICGMVEQKKGNYMVFFPSYAYMENIKKYMPDSTDCSVIYQESQMDEAAKEDFLMQFEKGEQEKTLIGMCVMGGIFSEGIDLKADRLIGAIIVGTGLPQYCSEQEMLKEYFDINSHNQGFAYAYTFPGFNKVLQSAGRVIRTEKDKGVILLLDVRFFNRDYDGMFPAEWDNIESVNVDNFRQYIRDFWA